MEDSVLIEWTAVVEESKKVLKSRNTDISTTLHSHNLAYPMSRRARYASLMILSFEGDWSNHSHDPGGVTQYGVTARFNRDFAQIIRKKQLSKLEACCIAYTRYYLNKKLDLIKDDSLAVYLMDIFYGGLVDGVRQVQFAANQFIKNYGLFGQLSLLVEDGILGKATISTLNYISRYGFSSYFFKSFLISNESQALKELAVKIDERIKRYQMKRGLPYKNQTKGYYNRAINRAIMASRYNESANFSMAAVKKEFWQHEHFIG